MSIHPLRAIIHCRYVCTVAAKIQLHVCNLPKPLSLLAKCVPHSIDMASLKALGHDIRPEFRTECRFEFEVHGAQERKLAAHVGLSNTRSGLYTVNKQLTVLLLQVPMCRASVGRCFHEDMAGQSSYSKVRIRPYMCMTLHRAWAHGLISAYIVIQCNHENSPT